MKTTLKLLIAITLACFIARGMASAKEPAKPKSPQASEVLIVESKAYNKTGVAQGRAISLIGKEKIQAFVKMFPDCCNNPQSSKPPHGYETEHTAFLFLENGKTIRMSIGANGSLWSCGAGDFNTAGDFATFLKEVQK